MDTYPEQEVAVETEETEKTEESRGRGCGCWILVLLVLLAGGAATGYLMGTIILREETPCPAKPKLPTLVCAWSPSHPNTPT